MQFWRRRDRRKEELEEELQSHLRMATAERIERGEAAGDARDAALREFGNVALVEDVTRDMWAWARLDELRQDVRFALRMLRRNRGLTVVILVTLTLGIGANTAIFSVVHAVLFRPFDYPHPERLVVLSERAPGLPLMYISLPNLRDWQARSTAFESIQGFRSVDVTLTEHGDPQRLQARQVSAGFFPMLGIEPILGRSFTAADDKPNARRVVLLSDSFWARQLGRDPVILHKPLLLDGQPYTVIGVVPSSRCHMSWKQVDVFTPLGLMENLLGGPAHRDVHQGLWAYARLKPGVTLQQARADMDAIARQLGQEYPVDRGQAVNVEPLLHDLVRGAREPLMLLMTAVGLVLLIACANVANLLLSLGIVRRRETAVRTALGISASRLARQHLCESILLALVGGTLGLLLAYLGTTAIAHMAASSLPRVEEVSIDRSVLLFTFGTSLLSGIAFGVFPALLALHIQPNEVLKDTICGSRHTRVGARAFLAAGELALSLVLLVATGLSVKSFYNLARTDLGFQPANVLTASLRLPDAKYRTDAQRTQFMKEFTEKLSTLSGVKAVGFVRPFPGGAQTDFLVEGAPKPTKGNEPYVEVATATPGALEALGVKLVKGRRFNQSDDARAPLAVIIDDILAAQNWPGEDPIGKRLSLDFEEVSELQHSWWTVIGVIPHLEVYGGSRQALPEAFLSMQQLCASSKVRSAGSWCDPGRLLISSNQDRTSLEPVVRDALYSLDQNLALYDIAPLTEITGSLIAPERLLVVLLSSLAAIALLLAAAGTYGVMSYMVLGRTSEIGVHRALGAERTDVLRMVFREAMLIIAAGSGLGVVASLTLGHLLGPMLVGVGPRDPLMFASTSGLLMLVAMLACYIPARKAMRMNPMLAVRHE